MSFSILGNENHGLARRLARHWQEWRARRRTQTELACCGRDDAERMAQDMGLERAELYVLAGKWPTSADLLTRRMAEIQLDASTVAQVEPGVIRDLQRVCSLCASKRRCRRDLAGRPSNPVWHDYCPNAMTLTALGAEHIKQA